jgi:hypothetical protein
MTSLMGIAHFTGSLTGVNQESTGRCLSDSMYT